MTNYEETLDLLAKIVTELDARETSNNCAVDELIGVPWDDLCEKGIELFKQLKA